MGTASNGSYAKAEGETLLSEGDEYTVTADVSLTARYKPLNIILTNNGDNYTRLSKCEDMTAVSVTLQGRTLYKDGSWNILTLPFDASVTEGPFADATLMELDTEAGSYAHATGFDNGTLYLNFKSAQSIEAGKPYIIKWEGTSGTIDNPVFNNVTIVYSRKYVMSSDKKLAFYGNYGPESFNEEENRILYLGANNTLYYPKPTDAEHPVTINSFRALFRLIGVTAGESAEARTFVLNFDGDEATGVIEPTSELDPATINLADNADNSKTLDAFNDKTVNSVTLQGRTLFKDGDWNTLCLPFDVTVSKSPLSGDGVQVMELDAAATHFDVTDLLIVHFEPISGDVLKAGVPYIIKWDNTGENLESPVFSDVKINSAAPAEIAFNGGQFSGNYSPFEINADNINEIVYLGAGNTLGYADEPRTLRSFRAHFEVPSVNGARAMTRSIVYFGDETTGIVDVEANSSFFTLHSSLKEGWYTIDGRKLSGEPTAKGVYIHNGRKVIVK